jgi:hypothetical protein
MALKGHFETFIRRLWRADQRDFTAVPKEGSMLDSAVDLLENFTAAAGSMVVASAAASVMPEGRMEPIAYYQRSNVL